MPKPRAIRQSGKIIKGDRDNFNELNIFRRVNKMISRVATSNILMMLYATYTGHILKFILKVNIGKRNKLTFYLS